MNKPTVYIDGIYRKSTSRKLSLVRKLAERLLDTLEEQEIGALQGQSMEALKLLLRALNASIQIHEEQEMRDSPPE